MDQDLQEDRVVQEAVLAEVKVRVVKVPAPKVGAEKEVVNNILGGLAVGCRERFIPGPVAVSD